MSFPSPFLGKLKTVKVQKRWFLCLLFPSIDVFFEFHTPIIFSLCSINPYFGRSLAVVLSPISIDVLRFLVSQTYPGRLSSLNKVSRISKNEPFELEKTYDSRLAIACLYGANILFYFDTRHVFHRKKNVDD